MQHPWTTRLERAALFGAACLATTTLLAAVGLGFHGASSQPWLLDTPQARLAQASCPDRRDHAARLDCLRRTLAGAPTRTADTAGAADTADTAGAQRVAALAAAHGAGATATAPAAR